MKYCETKEAPAAIGPYSQAIITGNLMFCSGQIPVNPAVGKVESADIIGQTEQVCKNIKALLASQGLTMDKVVKTTCFLADIADFKAFNDVYARYFVGKPARSCVAVKDLPMGVLCEIEVIAEVHA